MMTGLKISNIKINNKDEETENIYKLLSSLNDKVESAINGVIDEANKCISVAAEPFDDDEIKNSIDKILLEIKNASIELKKVESKIPAEFDDADLIKKITDVEGKIPAKFDDANLMLEIKRINDQSKDLLDAITLINKNMISIQKEIRSNRKSNKFDIDTINQKLNLMTEV